MRYYFSLLFATALLVVISATGVMAQGMRFTPEDRAKQLKDTLGLSEKQTEQVLAIFKEMGAKRQALMDSIEDRDARRDAMRSLMTQSDEKVEKLLTPEQKEKYEAIKKDREARFRQRPN